MASNSAYWRSIKSVTPYNLNGRPVLVVESGRGKFTSVIGGDWPGRWVKYMESTGEMVDETFEFDERPFTKMPK
jgi:hypothetical protein